MDYPQNDKGKYRGEHKSRGNRMNRGNRYPSRQQQNHYYDGNECNVDPSLNDNLPLRNAGTEAGAPSRSFYNSAQEFTNHPTQSKSQYGAPNSKHAQNSNPRTKKGYENVQRNFNSYDSGAAAYQPETESAAGKHGNIIGGRYIRKHSSQPVNPRTRNQKDQEDRGFEQNLNAPQPHFSSYKSKNGVSENRLGQARTFPNEQRRHFFNKNTNGEDYARKGAHSEAGNALENSFASSDVYRYSSQNVNERKPFKPSKERYPKSQFSSVSSYYENEATQRGLYIVLLMNSFVLLFFIVFINCTIGFKLFITLYSVLMGRFVIILKEELNFFVMYLRVFVNCTSINNNSLQLI